MIVTTLKLRFSLCLCVIVTLSKIKALNNGLALTPPSRSHSVVAIASLCSSRSGGTTLLYSAAVGWMQWERFRCNVDCENDPNNCISENLFKQIADMMVSGGYRDAGYEYVCVDDCWSAKKRTKDGKLQADPKRFPSGMKALANYIHSRGLKFGLYADYGTKTCAGYPGSIDHVRKDAETFAEWGVDYLKLDGCYAEPSIMDKGYPKFTKALNATDRPIVFSCSWPAYQVFAKMKPDYKSIAKHCNLWRNYGDIQDSWNSVLSIVDWYGKNQKTLIPAAGPGHWNDPDMLIIGNFGLSYEQSKTQFALWAILASPLLMSNDLRDIDCRSREILLNREIIAVNQDKLGIQGKRVYKSLTNGLEVWRRPLSCKSIAVAVVSRRVDQPVAFNVTFKMVGFYRKKAQLRDLYQHKELGTFKKLFEVKVNPSGVVIVKMSPV